MIQARHMNRNGVLIINKPLGITSHDVVDIIRKKLNTKRVGHAGTLDPQATGVLVILLGGCTKFFERFLSYDKEYVATLTLGKRTSSADMQGKVLETKDFCHVQEQMVRNAMPAFTGDILQVPPMVSAVKYKGKRLYKLALQGKEVKREPRKITVKELKLLEFNLPDIRFYLRCSKGTYVRQLAEDLAASLDCVGYVSSIERLSVGPFNIKSAINLEDVTENNIQSYSG